jgi:DNA-directed RNA polymerase subunit M/transcription elongation factor TFIIS
MFCKVCNNLLIDVCTADTFTYKCSQCDITYEPTAKDTLRYDDIKGTNLIVYQCILQNANVDPVGNKAYVNCIKCDSKIVSQMRLGDNMRLVNTCIECAEQWLEGA